jgi:hypothetical protein
MNGTENEALSRSDADAPQPKRREQTMKDVTRKIKSCVSFGLALVIAFLAIFVYHLCLLLPSGMDAGTLVQAMKGRQDRIMADVKKSEAESTRLATNDKYVVLVQRNLQEPVGGGYLAEEEEPTQVKE